VSRWLKFEDEMPPLNVCVLMCDCYSNIVTLGRVIREREGEVILATMFVENLEADSSPTHWMPLPELPNTMDDDANETVRFL